jgi:hypothetical protein
MTLFGEYGGSTDPQSIAAYGSRGIAIFMPKKVRFCNIFPHLLQYPHLGAYFRNKQPKLLQILGGDKQVVVGIN